MKSSASLLATMLLCVGLVVGPAVSQDALRPKPEKRPSLCGPGFVFAEFITRNVDDHVAFFKAVTSFELMSYEKGYATLKSDRGELVFMEGRILPDGHPNKIAPNDRRFGFGLELAVIVPDLDKSFAAFKEFEKKGFRLSAGIGRRPWGARDFRVLLPDGYYIRFSEAM
jgi:catechol 2,3-dioxygenase-like lactoylglutathione lyase family enzyme